MKKLSYVITVDEYDVHIENRPIDAIRIGDETEEELAARKAENIKWKRLKLPVFMRLLWAGWCGIWLIVRRCAIFLRGLYF